MSNVNSYVNTMRQGAAKMASVNPNSEISQVKRELIEYYKTNPMRAWALINGSTNNTNTTEGQRMHLDAANIAVNGYSTLTTPPPSMNMFTPPTQVSEMEKLKSAGWSPLNTTLPPTLLNE